MLLMTFGRENTRAIKWRAMVTIPGSSPDELAFRHSGTSLEMQWVFFSIASSDITRVGIKKNQPGFAETRINGTPSHDTQGTNRPLERRS
jgi:hypothetical protein